MTYVNVSLYFPSDVLPHNVRKIRSTQKPKQSQMKLNFTELMRLPYHIQAAICHNSDNEKLQEAFPQCFSEEGSHQIPWSYINREGHIGKECYNAEGYEYGIGGYLDKMNIPHFTIFDYETQGHLHLEKDHPIWLIPAEHGKPFYPTLVEVKGQLLLVVSMLDEQIAEGIPASIIDFSK
ncbi:MAG: hypothetical protein KBB54_01215 [Candidatus Pacebacteria bacterium]|jgi:hypothetical protein|nr:hypothetical protein [Candidatus Paceibacterota bacterium]MBP9818483.1 hypothetical protein [Candidatus Paceibacterota bacterium]